MTPRGPHRRAAELERRPGHGSRARPLRDPAPTGVPVAVGRTACATTGEREAPLRSRLARTRRPRVAAACRPGPRHRPHGRGGRDGRALGRRRRALQVLLTDVPVQVVARSEQQATGHALHGHRWLLSQHRAPLGGTPPRRRRPHSSRIDQLGACSKGGGWWVRRAGQTGSDRNPCWLSGVRFHQGRLIVCGPAIRRGAARHFHGQGAEKPETRDWTPIEVEARSACIEPDEWASLPTVLGQRDAARLRRR